MTNLIINHGRDLKNKNTQLNAEHNNMKLNVTMSLMIKLWDTNTTYFTYLKIVFIDWNKLYTQIIMIAICKQEMTHKCDYYGNN